MPLDRSQSQSTFASLKLTASSSSSVGTHYIRSIYNIYISLSLLSSLRIFPILCRTNDYSQLILIGKISSFEILLHFSLSLSLSLSSDSLHSHVPHFRASHRYLYCICAYLDRSCWLLVSKGIFNDDIHIVL